MADAAIHRIERLSQGPDGYGDGLSDVYVCECGERFSEVQYGGDEEALGHLEQSVDRDAHRVDRIFDDPEGYGDGLSDIYACICGERFDAVQAGGAEEAMEHLEEIINA